MDHYRKLQRPHLARWRRTLCPPLHESTFLATLLRHFRSVPGRVGIGCDSLSSAALQIKSQEPSLRGILYYPPAPPMGDLMLLARSSPEVCSIPLPLHTRCAPVPCPLHSPHIFRGLAAKRVSDQPTRNPYRISVLWSFTRRRYRYAMCLCPVTLFRPSLVHSCSVFVVSAEPPEPKVSVV